MAGVQFQVQPDLSTVLAVYGMLLLAGTLYNWAIAVAEREGWLEGFIWLSVVIGVLFTLGCLALISWEMALVVLGGFVASGLPMAAGAIWRYIKARERGQEHDRQAARMAERGARGAGLRGGGGDPGDPEAEADAAQGIEFHRD